MTRKEERAFMQEKYEAAYGRMEKGEEPTAIDWWLFRRLWYQPVILSKKKIALMDYLTQYLADLNRPYNKEELFTLRICDGLGGIIRWPLF